jgi:hypothetical protein
VPYRRPAPKPTPVVHIHDEAFPSRALCGITWTGPIRGGRVASDTTPPVVVDEAGSANAATCRTCLSVWRRRLAGRP